MATCLEAQQKLGAVSMFLGVETDAAGWSLAQFDQAAQWASAHKIDTLLIKVFDGANGNVGSPDEWYGPIGGFAAVKKTVEARGVRAIPYGYLYGNSKGSVLADELNLVEKYMNTYGAFIGDMEMEWSGHVDWATTLNGRLSSNPNFFYASVLADPQPQQNEGAVFRAMAPSVNAWMPQVYDAFLDSVYASEFGQIAGNLCILPTIDLSNEFGTNDPLAYTRGFGMGVISMWEYQYATANPTLLDSIVQTVKGSGSVVLSSTGEVADFCDADQFQPAKTQDACGFFAVACVDAAAPVGRPCLKTVTQTINDAEGWYAQYNGDNSISNQMGMSVPQLQQLLSQVGFHWFQIAMDINVIRQWVHAGFPVIIAGAEAGMFDMGLGDVVPYYWNYQSFNHIITLTGVTSDGNFLVRDSANVTDLNNPNSLRAGPRKYDASKLSLISAHAVIMHGQAVPQVVGGVPVGVPTGWKDDGTTLTASNGIPVRTGFRNEVLNNNWDAGNVPEAPEATVAQPLMHAHFGPGTAQLFRDDLLWWTQAQGVVREKELGIEIFLRDQLIASQNSQITALKQELAAAQAAGGGIPAPMQQAINQAESTLQQAATALQPFVK